MPTSTPTAVTPTAATPARAPEPPTTAATHRMTTPLLVTLALLTGIAPFATDMYLAAFPALADDLGTSASGVQLTLTSFLVGLAVGQVVLGPLSDQRGRRRLLLVGAAVTVLASVACALAPSIGVLVAARFVQGVAGAAGIVLARAVVTDVAHGVAAARVFSMLMVVQGVAPIVAPLAGSALFVAAGWRSVFWALTGLSAVMLVAAALAVPETLPVERRSTGGTARLRADAARVLGDRRFVAYLVGFVASFAIFFAYIAASPFVLQTMLGLSAGQYAAAFAVNALGIMLSSAVAGRLVGRVDPRRLVLVGAAGLTLASVALLTTALLGAVTLWPTLVAFFLVPTSLGLVAGNATMLAMARAPQAPGTASALLGALQFLLAAVVSPLVGAGGETTTLPMAVTMSVAAVLVVGGFAVATRTEAP